MPYTQVSNLDYIDIKTALKDYLRANSDFTSYDFEGSALSHILDVLAYNTYYTAFNTNMVVNELFLDSATLRDNVVRIAKQLGYTPKSVTAPQTEISFQVNFTGSYPNFVTLKAGTGFQATFDDTPYRFVTLQDQKVNVNSGVANFYNVEVREGSLIRNSYTVDTSLENQRFILDNANVDTNTIEVRVYQSENATSFQLYQQESDILDVDQYSKVFFVDETEDERYEVLFGDGVFGRALENGEFIEIQYLISNGTAANDVQNFTFSGVLEDDKQNSNWTYTISNINPSSKAFGGASIESIDKIKYNAPKLFAAQNRAVTARDYAAIARNVYPAIADIITYGGEEEEPPQYGKVFIAIKPEGSAYLTSFTKQQIVTKLKPYMVASVTPEIKDPSILYVELTSNIYYDTTVTRLTREEIRKKVIDGVQLYTSGSSTEKFNGKFRYSKYVGVIDDADRSISSNLTSVMMRKDFYPQINSQSYYEICYQNEFDIDCDEDNVVFSSGFTVQQYPNFTVYMEDRDGKVALYRLDSVTGEKITVDPEIGTVDYVKGEFKIDKLTIIKGTFSDNRIELRARPRYNDIVAKREVYLDVDIANSKFTAYQES